MDYAAIPVSGGFSMEQVEAMRAALASADGPVLAFCRSGTRSTNLWSLARASMGDSPQSLSEKAAAQGYDLSPLMGALTQLSSRSEEHTSELQSLMRISYAVFCLKKNKNTNVRLSRTQTTTNKQQT